MWVLLLGAGLWLTLGAGGWQFRKFPQIFKQTFGHKESSAGGVSPFAAMTTALASTVGTGNIAGVATAIVAGGPGAIFWMWVSSLLGMMTKYAEVVLAVKTRKVVDGKYLGGPMITMESIGWRGPAVLFSVFAICSSLFIGNVTQVNTMAETCKSAFDVPPIVVGVITAVLAGLVLAGGIGSIAKTAEKLVPLMSGIFLVLSFAVLFLCRDRIVPVLGQIVAEAFHPRAAAGGVGGVTVIAAIRYGVSRGVFSNEAGLGSSPIAHASAQTNSPHRQGLWGMLEVFIDTIVLCTITALVILCTGVLQPGGADGAALTLAGFESVLGVWGGKAISFCTVLFGLATILGWNFYGEQCLRYLFPKNPPVKLYRLVYCVLIVPGACISMQTVWRMADLFNGLMAVPNLLCLFALSGVVFRQLKDREQRTENR